MKQGKFWMVYGVNQGPAQVAQRTHGDAVAEAKRLAQKVPGAVFVVLEVVDAYTYEQPVTRLEVDYIPF